MRRHTVLKLAGRLDHPGERYTADWRTWMRRADTPPSDEVVHFETHPIDLVGDVARGAIEQTNCST